MVELLAIVTAWMTSRDAISSRWQLANTGFSTMTSAQKGINEFTASMDYRTKELMASVARQLGEGEPLKLRNALVNKELYWFQFRNTCATSFAPDWSPLHSEGLYELVMNFDKFL